MAAIGREGYVSITPGNDSIKIEGIAKFLREASQSDERFNKEMRSASRDVAKLLLDATQASARGVTRSRQAVEVMKGMRVKNDRLPTIQLSGSSGFVSASNPNRNRRTKVTRADVFFGAEFGGGVQPRTRQFLRHRGKSGYFFWPTVRAKKDEIAKEYLAAIQRVLSKLADGG